MTLLPPTTNLWDWKPSSGRVLRVIPTNGVVQGGDLVMGAGLALQAKERFPSLPGILGKLVQEKGNNVYVIKPLGIASFPTKVHWKNPSLLPLVRRSASQLRQVEGWDAVLLPKVGCGLGGLSWPAVRMVLEEELPRPYFYVIGE